MTVSETRAWLDSLSETDSQKGRAAISTVMSMAYNCGFHDADQDNTKERRELYRAWRALTEEK